MTLGKAIDEAFGRTGYARRERWPTGSVGVIDCLSENPFEPFLCTVGRVEYVSKKPTPDDLAASDWYPCDIKGEQPTDDWRAVLATKGQGTRSIGRGDQCEVWLDGCALDGGCTLAWVKPHELSLLVAHDRIAAWPDAGIVMPRRSVSLAASGLVREFRLLSVVWQSVHDGSRLYRLGMAERTQVHH